MTKKTKDYDFDKLETFLVKWIDYVSYSRVYEKVSGQFARGKAKSIIKLIKKTYNIL